MDAIARIIGNKELVEELKKLGNDVAKIKAH